MEGESYKFDILSMMVETAKKHQHLHQLQFLRDDYESVVVRRIGENGVINAMFCLTSGDGAESVVVKYGEEKAAANNEVYPLSRQELEYNCLTLLHYVLPGSVPQPYCLDQQQHIIVMEDLSGMEDLGDLIKDGVMEIDTASTLGTLLGSIHKKTHRKIVSPHTWKLYQQDLKNEAITEQVLYYRLTGFLTGEVCLIPGQCSQFYKDCVSNARTREVFDDIRKLYLREDCLVHADPHLYSFLHSSQRTVVIDFEFGSLGNHAFSLAFLAAFYVMGMREAEARLEQRGDEGRLSELPALTRDALTAMFEAFFKTFEENIAIFGPLEIYISEMAVFAGQVLLTYPLADGFENLVRLNSDQKLKTMKCGYRMMVDSKGITTTDKLLDALLS